MHETYTKLTQHAIANVNYIFFNLLFIINKSQFCLGFQAQENFLTSCSFYRITRLQ